MSDYLKVHGSRTRTTSQKSPMRADQAKNSAGGFVWEVDKWTRLERFLILGSEGGTYYVSERNLTFDNIESLHECIHEDGPRTVNMIVDVSDNGRAPSNDPALYALAAALSLGNHQTKLMAGKSLPKVARIATHLYHFVAYMETMRGWGRMARKAVSEWYAQNPNQLAYQAVKYRQRDGWSHRDLLRLAHPSTSDFDTAAIYSWITGHAEEFYTGPESALRIIEGFEAAQKAKTPAETAALVREFNLPREALLTGHLNKPVVWEALLEQKMPLHAMVRNLATMTRIGILDSREHLELVLDALGSKEVIQKSRMHPMALLIALGTYAAGRGDKGTNTWSPKATITDALDEAFYLAFDNVVPTGKRHLLAIDVSGSMDSGRVAGTHLTPREAAAAMVMVTLHAEKDVEVVGFHSGAGGLDFGVSPRWAHYGLRDALTPIGFSRRQRLDDVVRTMQAFEMGGTDCALPFRYATELNKKIDAFIVYTDNETWAGAIHPKQALDQYRRSSGIAAKSVVVGMTANKFTIADPRDPGMLDVVGMDSAAPAVIADFVR